MLRVKVIPMISQDQQVDSSPRLAASRRRRVSKVRLAPALETRSRLRSQTRNALRDACSCPDWAATCAKPACEEELLQDIPRVLQGDVSRVLQGEGIGWNDHAAILHNFSDKDVHVLCVDNQVK